MDYYYGILVLKTKQTSSTFQEEEAGCLDVLETIANNLLSLTNSLSGIDRLGIHSYIQKLS